MGEAKTFGLILQRAQINGADFDVAAFALDADVAGVEGAFGRFVDEFAVDEGLNFVVDADSLGLVPFANRIFDGIAAQRDGCVFIHALVLLGFRTFHQKQIALMAVLALHLDAHRPNFVGRLDVDKDTGVIGLGRNFDEAPDDGEKIIAVNLRSTEVADGFAGAMNDAVGDVPGFEQVSVVLHAKRPAGKILLVEERDGHFAGARWRVSCIAILRQYGLHQHQG